MKNKTVSEIVRLVKAKNPDADTHLATMMVVNKLSQIASNMRVKYRYMDGGVLPVNFYGMALASSGFGKGKINNLLEEEIIDRFQKNFMERLAPSVANQKLEYLAETKSITDGVDLVVAQAEVYKEWNKLPKHLYSFNDATIEGLKAKRAKLSMIDLGSTNMEIDEIAMNIERVSDVMAVLLEAFDAGKAKQKLIKVDSNLDTSKVPSSLFMFGTPARLLNGSKAEKMFIELLDSGYARRMFFGLVNDEEEGSEISSEDRLKAMRDMSVGSSLNDVSHYLGKFADENKIGTILSIDDEVAIMILDYEEACKHRASELKKHQQIEKAEMKHRYWKATKLAGVLAFVDGSDYIRVEDIEDAINMAEESGEAFTRIMNRPANYVRLLDYLIDQGKKVTHADLVEQLDFYSSTSKQMKEEMIVLASAYAYSHNSVIKRNMVEGIEFISAKELEPSDGSKCILSISTQITEGYDNKLGEFSNLKNILKSSFKYCTHHFIDGYRDADHAMPKFNLIGIDVDDGTSLQLAMAMLSDYKYIIGTTKRHQTEGYGDRFRIIMMLDRTIEITDPEEYKKFMENIFDWLPFDVDNAAKDIARKWEGNPDALIFENDGEPITSIDFIPDTSRQKAMNNKVIDLGNLDGLERWFALNASTGDRNNTMHKYAMMLVDGGLNYEEVEENVLSMNSKLGDSLPEREIYSTIFKSVRKRLEEIE